MATSTADVQTATNPASEIVGILTERGVFVAGNSGAHLATNLAVQAAVSEYRTIELVLPAFPAKSGNREKTISHLPDFGEYLALSYLDQVCRRIAAIYSPGAVVRICSDGHVFSDLVGITDNDVDAYGQALAKMIRDERFSSLTTFALSDHYGLTDYNQMRSLLNTEFAMGPEDLRSEVQTDLDKQAVFNGIHRFLFEDAVVLYPHWSRSRARRESKNLAYEVIRRSDAWSCLVAQEFPSAVRLSIHPHPRSTAKLGIKLVDGGGPWATPWHNAVIKMGSCFQLIKRRDAELLGAALAYADGKYAYFEL